METATPRKITFRAAGGNKSEPETDPKYKNEAIQVPNLNAEFRGGLLHTSQIVGTLATSHVNKPIVRSERR